MKKINEKMLNHISSEVSTLCYCWSLKLRAGKKFNFTECDCDLVIENEKFIANSGFNPTAVSSSSNLSVDNLEISGVLDHESISESALLSGEFDFAEIEIFIVNYNDIEAGKISVRKGWFGEVNFTNQRFTSEVRGLVQAFSKNIGDLYSPLCRASFCDNKCKLKKSDFSSKGIVTKIINNSSFVTDGIEGNRGNYTYGLVVFANGQKAEVKHYSRNVLELSLPIYKEIKVGDEFEIITGCDKSFSTCSAKYRNAINFRGEPHIPGMSEMFRF
jgi:uncharacterized phage protein (TIGR02218 family)